MLQESLSLGAALLFVLMIWTLAGYQCNGFGGFGFGEGCVRIPGCVCVATKELCCKSFEEGMESCARTDSDKGRIAV
jgi:hypothetical protein